ncbi:ABC transporter permease [Aliicoccus persicus]|uniref:Peptide/nickel transport system permease protein n=1 Tax=Aliicoccus persicus TaxID=930138 RepID=A0A662Z2L0_9STAP|nr:ABC transporter permease [Aliicoccus persicus]SEV95846.1 peptide/nickel transport system permease protein [Aliicoccus persicus]
MKFITRKLLSFIATLIIISMLIFFIFNILPGNPALSILGLDADPSEVARLEASLGLDQPLPNRYVDWVTGIFTGDFGESYRYRAPVLDIILERIPLSMFIGIYSLVLTLIIGIPLGIIIARTDGKWYSLVMNILTQLGISTPSFWIGFLLIFIFAVMLGWFPTYGFTHWTESILGALRSLFLPSFAIAITNIAVVIRYLRNSILDEYKKEYIKLARMKGLTVREITYRHVLRNSIMPVLTIIGLITADTMVGTIIIENVFALPGLGTLLVSSIEYRDFPLIQTLVMIVAIIIIVVNLLVDVLYRVVDPRVKL